MGTPEAGWYEFEGRRRWWDGAQWTDRYLDEESSQPPPPPPSGPRYDPAMDSKAAPDLHPQKTSWAVWACGGCLVIPLIIFGIVVATSGSRPPYDPNNKLEAVSQCEDLVESQLKAPSTAKFNSSAASSGSGTWTVSGTVDAQNGFGAQIRTTFQCTMRVTNGKIERRIDYLG